MKKISRGVALAAVAMLTTSCVFDLAHGLVAYDSADTRFGFARTSSTDAKGNEKSSVVFDTKGAVGEQVLDKEPTIREWAIKMIKNGKTIDAVAKAIGIDPTVVREWIQ